MAAPGEKIELSRLSTSSLSSSGQVLALSALVHLHSDQDAFEALSSLTGRGDALHWLITLATADPGMWHSEVAWPAKVPVPNAAVRRLMDGVFSEAVAAPNGPRVERLSRLLPRLQPDDYRRKWSRAVLRDAGDSPLGVAARTLLAGSVDATDRQALRRDANAAPLLERVQRLAGLSPTLQGRGERTDVATALEEMAGTRWAPQQLVLAAVQELAAMTDDRWLSRWVAGPWAHPAARTAVLDETLGKKLGAERLTRLVTKDLAPDVLDALCDAADGIPTRKGEADVLARAYELGLTPAMRHAQRFVSPVCGDAAVRAQVWPIVLAADNRNLDRLVADVLDPGELTAVARRYATDDRVSERVASVAGHLADGYPAESASSAPGDVWANEIVAVQEILGTPFIVALPDYLRETLLPDNVLSLALGDVDAIRSWTAAGFGDQLVTRAVEESDEPARRLLEALAGDLDPEDLIHLADAVGDENRDRWAKTLEHMQVAPEVLMSLAIAAAETLTGPEGGHASPHRLATLVFAAVSAGMGRVDNVATMIKGLLDHPDERVTDAGVVWATALHVTAADQELIDAIIAADDALGGTFAGLVRLRADYGEQLASRARDVDLFSAKRVACLDLAARTSSHTARAAAFGVYESSSAPMLKEAAAKVLATTEGLPTDVPRLQSLHDAENRQGQKALLLQALHNVESRTVTEAIAGLLEAIGLTIPTSQTAAKHLIRDSSFESAFVAAADKVRAATANKSNPSDLGTKANVLADLLVDLALLAAADSGEKGTLTISEAGSVRENAAGRPDSGDLIRRPSLLHKFAWFSQCEALRPYRDAHPAPVGTVEPNRATPDDSGAIVSILRQVVSGWVQTMKKYPRPATEQ